MKEITLEKKDIICILFLFCSVFVLVCFLVYLFGVYVFLLAEGGGERREAGHEQERDLPRQSKTLNT